VAARSEAGVKVDRGQRARFASVLAQHLSQDAIAPRRPHAAVEKPIGEFALAAAYRGLQRGLAVRGDVSADPASFSDVGGHAPGTMNGWTSA
jgi:hypothetical protein